MKDLLNNEKQYLKAKRKGAKTIVREWIEMEKGESLLIVTDNTNMEEANLIKEEALKVGAKVDLEVMKSADKDGGVVYDENPDAFDGYDAIIGASDYSIITVAATKKAIDRKARFLSLPLSTNNGVSMLAYNFMNMDPNVAELMANVIMEDLEKTETIEIKTELGTDLIFKKKDRKVGLFNGTSRDGDGFASASFEIYMSIEEDKTQGTFIVDGSLGCIGIPEEPITMKIKDGKAIEFEDTEAGDNLREYFESFEDDRMFVASELGIGLNLLSKTEGNSYIEDESAYRTFHIGFGRNTGLGGKQEAVGHFDLVTLYPDIYADGKLIMKEGHLLHK